MIKSYILLEFYIRYARILDKAIIKGNIMVSANSVVRGNTTLNDVMP